MTTSQTPHPDAHTLDPQDAAQSDLRLKAGAFEPTAPPAHVAIVFPGSDRVRVANTQAYPYSTIGQLEMTFPNGETYTGTGTLIAPDFVLTAAHNLFGKDIGGWAKTVTFSAGREANAFPFGKVPAQNIFVTDDYRSLSPPNPNQVPPGDIDYALYTQDFGLVKLSKSVNTGTMRMLAASDEELAAQTFNVTGYPGDKPEGTMWGASGKLISFPEEFLFYKISSYRGQSGSGVTTPFPKIAVPRICGIHVAGSTHIGDNFAVRINDDVIKTVQGWMFSEGYEAAPTDADV